MGKLKSLSGNRVCRILESNGFDKVRQQGSHIVMQKRVDNTTITVPVPNHKSSKLKRSFPDLLPISNTLLVTLNDSGIPSSQDWYLKKRPLVLNL